MVDHQEIKAVVSFLVASKKIKEIYLFGSAAKQQTNDQSDIDLLLIGDTLLPSHRRVGQFYRELHTKSPVDLVMYTPEEFAERRTQKNTLAFEVASHGIRVYPEQN